MQMYVVCVRTYVHVYIVHGNVRAYVFRVRLFVHTLSLALASFSLLARDTSSSLLSAGVSVVVFSLCRVFKSCLQRKVENSVGET